MKKRLQNDLKITWTILNNDVAVDFSDATNIKLYARIVNSKEVDITAYSGRTANVFTIAIPANKLNIGVYDLILVYNKPCISIVGGLDTHATDVYRAFEIVKNSADEDAEGRYLTSNLSYSVDGATYTPAITETAEGLLLSWTNDRGFPNPDPVLLNEGIPQALVDIAELEGLIELAESARVSAENLRVSAEQARVTAEGLRVTAESSRVDVEAARVIAENARVIAEGLRVSAEQARVTAEGLRVTAENARVQAEQGRVTAEGLRVTAEGARVTAEGLRVTAEQGRVTA
jgi:leucine proline-enriched proteoglycan (leprecan)